MRYLLLSLLLISTHGFAAEVQLDQFGLTGTWYNPATSGQGFMFEVYPDIHGDGNGVIFGGWFTYDASGTPTWYSLQGNITDTDSAASLDIYNSQNGYFDHLPSPTVYRVGQGTLSFSDCEHASFSYVFNTSGAKATIPLTRLTPSLTCSDNGVTQLFPTANTYWISGSWYDKNVSGQGLIFDIASIDNQMFGGWFTYASDNHRSDATANQRWYSLQIDQAPVPKQTLTNIPIYATSGGVFNAPSNVTQMQVGTATLTAHTCSSITVTYSFTAGENAGLTGSMDLQRPGPTPVDCDFDPIFGS